MNITKNVVLSLSVAAAVLVLSGCFCCKKKSCSLKHEPVIEQPIEEANDTKVAKF